MNSLQMTTRQARADIRNSVRRFKAEAQAGAKSQDKGPVKPVPKKRLPKKHPVNTGTKPKTPKSSS